MLLTALTFVIATLAAFGLYLRVERLPPVRGTLMLAALRAAAWGLVAALLVNPGCARAGDEPVTVLLDASRSMSDPVGEARWRQARERARDAAGGSGRILGFGTEPRLFSDSVRPDAPATQLLPALREAAARGGRVVVVTDGVVDDRDAIPADLLASARVVLVPARDGRDAGALALDLPASLRAGDTALAVIDVAVQGAAPGGADTVLIELLEAGRVVARARAAASAGGVIRHELRFVPAAAAADREVRRYRVRVSGLAGDTEPRDDARETAAVVTRASAITLVSDSPDWDFRWLAQTLSATAGVPVRAFVRVGPAGWRETRSLRPVADAQVREEIARAALVVAHGGAEAMAAAGGARRALWRWPVDEGGEGDWYVQAPEFASPAGGALAGVPPESLPPLERIQSLSEDSVEWTALTAQLDRRGRSRPVVQGTLTRGRRGVQIGASGLWRWASRGGVASEAARALVAALTDWLLADTGRDRADLAALRDSLAREARELVPGPRTLGEQDGRLTAAAADPLPLRHSPWPYLAALLALITEWITRRRRGLR